MAGYEFLKADSVKIGKNCEIEHGAVLEDDVVIGDNCFIGYYAIIRPGVVIGNNTEIRSHCFIAEGVKIGSNVKIFQFSNIGSTSIIEDCVYIGVRVLLTNTRRIAHLRKYKPEIAGPYICYGARIASGAILLPGIKIGREALVGTGAIVAKDVPSREIHFGVPAVKRGNVPDSELIEKIKQNIKGGDK